jgi:hypothetical protein
MQRTSRIIRAAATTVALAALAVPTVGSATHHLGSAGGFVPVSAIGWPGTDNKPSHTSVSAIGWPGTDAKPQHKAV